MSICEKMKFGKAAHEKEKIDPETKRKLGIAF